MSDMQSGALVAGLQHAHWEWRKEVGEALARVRMPEAGVWERWAAVRYLMDDFGPRLDREAHILTGMADRLPAEYSGRVWALGELLQFLCHHLCELGAMPQCGAAFADAVTKLIRALDCWCAEVEKAVEEAEAGGPMPEAIRAFGQLFEDAEAAVPA
jgi:hypothetical protein